MLAVLIVIMVVGLATPATARPRHDSNQLTADDLVAIGQVFAKNGCQVEISVPGVGQINVHAGGDRQYAERRCEAPISYMQRPVQIGGQMGYGYQSPIQVLPGGYPAQVLGGPSYIPMNPDDFRPRVINPWIAYDPVRGCTTVPSPVPRQWRGHHVSMQYPLEVGEPLPNSFRPGLDTIRVEPHFPTIGEIYSR